MFIVLFILLCGSENLQKKIVPIRNLFKPEKFKEQYNGS